MSVTEKSSRSLRCLKRIRSAISGQPCHCHVIVGSKFREQRRRCLITYPNTTWLRMYPKPNACHANKVMSSKVFCFLSLLVSRYMREKMEINDNRPISIFKHCDPKRRYDTVAKSAAPTKSTSLPSLTFPIRRSAEAE